MEDERIEHVLKFSNKKRIKQQKFVVTSNQRITRFSHHSLCLAKKVNLLTFLLAVSACPSVTVSNLFLPINSTPPVFVFSLIYFVHYLVIVIG